MDKNIADYFADVIKLANLVFTEVAYNVDNTPERAILRLQAKKEAYRIFVTELFSDERRKYRYYVLQDEWIEVGFDNSPDPHAIKLKYGQASKKHSGEYVPHLHLENKTYLQLTNDMTFPEFVAWLDNNL